MMSERDPIRTRWAEEDSEDAAAKLMRQVDVPGLTTGQLLRVRSRLNSSLQSPKPLLVQWSWGRALATAAVGAVIGMVCGLAVHDQLFRSRAVAADSHRLALPPEQPWRESPRMVLVGPGEAVLAGADAPPRLIEGTLLVKTTDTLATITTPHSKVRVEVHSVTEIAVRGAEIVVGVHTGQAIVHWLREERQVSVTAGSAVSRKAVFPLPSERLQQVESWLSGRDGGIFPPSLEPLTELPKRQARDSDLQLQPRPSGDAEQEASAGLRAAAIKPLGKLRSKAAPKAQPNSDGAQELPQTPIREAVKTQGGASPPSSAADSALAESQLLSSAMSRWRQQHDPEAALRLLEEFTERFPKAVLRPEAEHLRVNLLVSLNRRREALDALDQYELKQETPRALELRVLRAELRARSGRCTEAVADFSAALGNAQGPLHERALYGRYRCHIQLGDASAAKSDREDYLLRFPSGRFAEPLKKELPSAVP